ncbi:MAG: ParB/RepB/Spo0J family partition protein [Anaerolineae bacterium]|nr:ParB/RepB/Spo0J family partition protein [Anaerolineae bacterium]
MPRRGLGRGLDVLIPGAGEPEAAGLRQLSLEKIVPNPHQPRTKIREKDLQELANSIQEHGIIQPLVVTRSPDLDKEEYQLIAGERRWRAARIAGLSEVPVIIKEAVPQQMLELALVENVQRADLNSLEEAAAYQQLVVEFGLSQSEIAQRVGKSRVAVTNTMRLLQASPKVQEAVMEAQITEGHARALLGLSEFETQEQALTIVIQQSLSVRQTEALVQKLREAAPKTENSPAQQPQVIPEIKSLENQFEQSLGTRVKLKAGRKGGRVVIYYYSDEEFRSLYERLTGQEL